MSAQSQSPTSSLNLTRALIEGRAFSIWSRTSYVEFDYELQQRVEYTVLDTISYFDGKVFDRHHYCVPKFERIAA